MDFNPQRYCTQWSWVLRFSNPSMTCLRRFLLKVVLSSGAIATNAAVRSASGDSFVDGGSKSSPLAIGDSTTSESLVQINGTHERKRFETCEVAT